MVPQCLKSKKANVQSKSPGRKKKHSFRSTRPWDRGVNSSYAFPDDSIFSRSSNQGRSFESTYRSWFLSEMERIPNKVVFQIITISISSRSVTSSMLLFSILYLHQPEEHLETDLHESEESSKREKLNTRSNFMIDKEHDIKILLICTLFAAVGVLDLWCHICVLIKTRTKYDKKGHHNNSNDLNHVEVDSCVIRPTQSRVVTYDNQNGKVFCDKHIVATSTDFIENKIFKQNNRHTTICIDSNSDNLHNDIEQNHHMCAQTKSTCCTPQRIAESESNYPKEGASDTVHISNINSSPCRSEKNERKRNHVWIESNSNHSSKVKKTSHPRPILHDHEPEGMISSDSYAEISSCEREVTEINCLKSEYSENEVVFEKNQRSRPPNPMAKVFLFISNENKFKEQNKQDIIINVERPSSPMSEVTISPLIMGCEPHNDFTNLPQFIDIDNSK